jgi:acyl carrier protein
MTIEDVRNVLVRAVAAEAGIPPAEFATDQPFTTYGLDSVSALCVGMEIEEGLGISDISVDLMWDHPTVDTLTEALWELMNTESIPVATES